MAGPTCILSLACALLVTSSHAQAPGGGGGAIPSSIMSMINTMTSGNNNQAFAPQLSLVESFGPISSQTISTGTQTGSSPFNQQAPPQNPPPRPPPTFQPQMPQQMPSQMSSQMPSQMTSQMQPQVTSQQMSSQLQPQVISQIQRIMSQMPMSSFMAPSMPSLQQTQRTGAGSPSGPSPGLAQFFGNGAASSATGRSSNAIIDGLAASKPLGNDILKQVTAYVNQGPPPLNPTSGRLGSMGAMQGGIPPMPPMRQGGIPPMPPMGGGGMGMPALPPMSVLGSLMPGMNSASMRNTAMLRVGRRIGSQFGVNQYYEMHGCADPTTLFTGRQRAMATMAMAQGCQSYQATRICKMAQVKERTGNSMMTSRFLPPQIRSRLEGCLSAKVLFNSMSVRSPLPVMGTGMGAGLLPARSTGAPSLRECGMLLSTVMDGGSLDPESMIATRRSMLPWSCNESNLGGNGIPYRVCCPGKVHEPTLQEASMLKNMMGA